MTEKKENKGLGLPQTRGTFQFKGIVTGTEKQNFYKETLTKTSQKPFRMVNFGVKTDKESVNYISLSGGEKENVYFSKSVTEDGKKKTITEKVAWKDRNKFNKEGFKLIGVHLGIKKVHDEKGNKVNDKKILTEYDACKEIYDNLKDDQSVFIRGNIDYSHFESNGETKRAVKFIPTQISLCKDVDFDEENFEPTADFTQVIVFTGIKKEEERFVVEAKIVNYNSIEEAEFFIDDSKLASTFKKNLKPYTAIKVWGKIATFADTSEVEEEDVWGESNIMEKINAPVRRELIITGADPNSIDKEIYSEEAIEEAITLMKANKKAENDFGVNDEWGSVGNPDNTEKEAW